MERVIQYQKRLSVQQQKAEAIEEAKNVMSVQMSQIGRVCKIQCRAAAAVAGVPWSPAAELAMPPPPPS